MAEVLRCKKCDKVLTSKSPKVFVKGLGVVCKSPCSESAFHSNSTNAVERKKQPLPLPVPAFLAHHFNFEKREERMR
jgi:phage FluMu protein Com